MVLLGENDPNDKFDLPPLRTPEEVTEDLHAKRAAQVSKISSDITVSAPAVRS